MVLGDGDLRRAVLAVACLALVIASCGGSMTETEYVEELNAIAARAHTLFEPVVDAYNQVGEPTLADEVSFLDQEIAIWREVAAPLDALDPPDSLTEIHELLSDLFERQLVAAEDLAPVAESLSSRDQLVLTPEFAEYEAVNINGSQACVDVQARLDDLAATRQATADVPWLPTLGIAAQATMGCSDNT